MDQTDLDVAQEFLQTEEPQTTDETTEEPETEPTEPQKFEDLPEWAQRELSKARREAAKYRVAAKKAPEADSDAVRAEIRREMATELAAAHIEAALTGIVEDPTAIVEDLNLSRYVTEDGEIDKDAITTLKSKYTRLVKRQSTGHGRAGASAAKSPADQFADVLRSLGA